ncbi:MULTISPECIES: murein transglycosylase A [unclassified Rhizobium]|uniref:murein transglycosylase A n=1 Tax=unclassified Rhizobium TaxID=2613769 RepID=UPI0007124809|nr:MULTISPECIES: murein transglycosylase A [unclassified Rhizobium]KQS87505.1 transglycosylase [Rhizobium sp. Leaf391]KQT06924.1 transglycosylase [Rhizobium sp. Leaf386]KQT95067.1 transglycosylase [Rhizobium sp. Leaf453]
MDFDLQRVEFSDLPGWHADDPSPLLSALERCRQQVTTVKPHKTASLGISSADLMPAYAAARHVDQGNAAGAIAFFEEQFVPFRIVRHDGKPGFVTAFFEPEVRVSATKDETFRFPFYRRPDDLVDIDDGNRPEGMDPYFAFGQMTDGVIDEYPDRKAIEQGYLAGRGLEIAYAKSKTDVFFAHVQGAARLVFPDGSMTRVTYAAKTGHYFSATGRLLIDRGKIDAATVSMQTIKQWLDDHPDEADEVLWHNRSFIFFREAAVDDTGLGPVAAAKVALEPGRSLAVDRLIHTFGTPFFISSDSLTSIEGGRPFRRLMLALDTGSAIVGPARGDIFTGSGDEAGRLAGAVRNDADFFIFIPKAAAARYGHG